MNELGYTLSVEGNNYLIDHTDKDIVLRFDWYLEKNYRKPVTRVEYKGVKKIISLLNLVSGLVFNEERKYIASQRNSDSDFRTDNIVFLDFENTGEKTVKINPAKLKNKAYYKLVECFQPVLIEKRNRSTAHIPLEPPPETKKPALPPESTETLQDEVVQKNSLHDEEEKTATTLYKITDDHAKLYSQKISEREELENLPVGTVVWIPLDYIERNPGQPRTYFNPEDLNELARSMRARGDVEDPPKVIIRKKPWGLFFAILEDGERRFRAAKIINLEGISCVIRPDAEDVFVFIRSARANFHRKDMSPIEEANAVVKAQKAFGWPQAKVAEMFGWPIGRVTNALKYFKLHEDVQKEVLQQKIDKGHALLLISYEQWCQPALLKFLKRYTEKKGGKINQHQAVIALRGEAERNSYPLLKPKKGRKKSRVLSHAELVMRDIIRNSDKLSENLHALKDVSDYDLTSQKTHILDLLGAIKELSSALPTHLDRIENLS